MRSSFRTCSGQILKKSLQDSHHQTVLLLSCFAEQLTHSKLAVPFQENLNPPLWEFGHVGWFKEYWTVRNHQRHQGSSLLESNMHFDPSMLPMADTLFNSATVPHEHRWQLPLLGVSGVRDYLDTVHDRMLEALESDLKAESSLYFYQLTLAHEWMHQEAFLMAGQEMALTLPGIAPTLRRHPNEPASRSILCPDQAIDVRANPEEFYFDNESVALTVSVAAFEVDTHPVSLGEFWDFVTDGGYQSRALWSPAGWEWRCSQQITGPAALKQTGQGLMRRWGAEWIAADPLVPMALLNFYEASAWCAWAKRRLLTEAEWCVAEAAGISWGDVWEWTSDPFHPFPGFEPHPYRDYSAPWFIDHWVLKGSSCATHPMLRDRRMRNFYRPHRRDVFAGFRSAVSC